MTAKPQSSVEETLRAVLARGTYGYFAWRLMQTRGPLSVLLGQARLAHQDVLAADQEVPVTNLEEIIVGAMTVFTRDVKRGTGDVIRHGCAGSAFQIVYSLFESHAAALKKPTGAKAYSGPLIAGEPFSRVLWAARSAFAHQDEWQRKGASGHPLALEAQKVLRAVGIAEPFTANAHDIFIAISGGSFDEFLRRILAAANELSDEIIGTTPIPRLLPMLRAVVIGRLFLSVLGLKANNSTFMTAKTISVPLGTGVDAVVELDENTIGTTVGAGSLAAFFVRWAAVKQLRSDAARPFTEFESRLESWWKQFEVLNQTEIESSRYVEDLAILCSRVDQLKNMLESLPSSLDLLAAQEGVQNEEDARRLVDSLLKEYKRPGSTEPDSPLDLTALFDPTGELFSGPVTIGPADSTTPNSTP